MRVAAAIKGQTIQGIFAGFTQLSSMSPQAVIVQEITHQPWMDEEPSMEVVVNEMWSNKVNAIGGQLIPVIHVPITFYSDNTQPSTQQPFNNPAAGHVPPMPGEVPDPVFPTIPNGVPPLMVPPMQPPVHSIKAVEKIIKIGDKKAKLIGDDVYIEDWVDVEPDRFRLTDLIVDGHMAEPDSFKIQKLDWVKQEE